MKTGNRVKFKNVRDPSLIDDTIYTIIDIIDKSVKVKHPTIKGYFIFLKSNIREVVSEN